MKQRLLQVILISLVSVFVACNRTATPSRLILKRNEKTSLFAYFDERGRKVLGDYYAAYTDTITRYGIVADPDFVLIDRTGKHIYTIYPVDNGPDETSDGAYRIIEHGKIGYVDALTSRVLIEPKFSCAFPFENGKAKVSFTCRKVAAFPGDEHPTWQSDNWLYVDKQGKMVK